MIRRGWFAVLAVAVAGLVLIVLALAHLRARVAVSRLPERGRSIQVIEGCPGLVEILFDGRGAPHVYSGSESALWFAQGYLHARDRFFQMDMARRTANGKLAEVFGQTGLEIDRKMRVLRVAASARRQAALLTARERRVLEVYAAGVNAAVKKYGSWIAPEIWLLGVEPQVWTVEDSLACGLLMQLDQSPAMGAELKRGVELSRLGREDAVDIWGWSPVEARAWIPPGDGVTQPAREYEAIPGPRERSGSNSWVVASSRSASGRPLLANDSQLSVQAPLAYYPIHLKGPTLEVAGGSVIGLPGVIIGHTRGMAWGLTPTFMDDQDLFRLTLDDDGARELVGGRWRSLRTVTEDISVRWQTEPVLVKVKISVHGPVIREQRGESLALAWSGLSGPSIMPAVLGMNRAETAADAAKAWESVIGPSMNLLAADAEGTILHQVVGRVPERARGAGRLPAPGSDPDWAWKGFLPMSMNPRRVDPPEGFLVAASHDLFLEGDYPVRQRFPAEFAPPWRVRRIRSALAMHDQWSVAECAKLQGDLVSGRAVTMLKQLRPELEEHGGDTARKLMGWDARMDARSMAARLYTRFELELEKAVAGDEAARQSLPESPVGPEEIVRLLAGGLDESWWDDVRRPGRQGRREILNSVLDGLDEEAEGAAWGDVHTVEFAHPLAWIPAVGRLLSHTWNRGPFPVGGDRVTVNTQHWDGQRPFEVTAIPALRFVTEVGNWDDSILGLPTGQSGRPWSGHYSDQVRGWLQVNGPVFPFSREAVERASVARLNLFPENVRIPAAVYR